jgi:signal transduction histidine kinase
MKTRPATPSRFSFTALVSWLAQYRLRFVFRGVFLLLMLATLYLALYVLQQEKQLSYKNYQDSFRKTRDQISATLRHPAGQLALLNPHTKSAKIVPLHPLLLPFSAIDFDDQHKAQQAAEMSGCLVQFKDQGALCVAVGNNPWAGGFIYVAGNFQSADLIPHQRGDAMLDQAHRVRVTVTLRGQVYRWIAPFEAMSGPDGGGNKTARAYGRLTGFIDNAGNRADSRPVKDFRGWVWQSAHCIEPALDAASNSNNDPCVRSSFFSIRLPVGLLQDALFEKSRPVWPPADLDRIDVHVTVLPPGPGAPLLDSDSGNALPPFSVDDLTPLLLPGETLQIKKLGGAADVDGGNGGNGERGGNRDLIKLTGAQAAADDSWQILNKVIRRLPVDAYDTAMESRESITTQAGSYEILLKGDVRSVNKSLSVVATRISWFVVAMLLALGLAWFVIEVRIIHRITILTKRAASLSKTVKGAGGLDEFDLSDLRGTDELGILASCLHDLLRRVREDVEREAIRAEQEKEMWHAVGHEIMSPLQSLMALHGATDNQSSRYINRMQQAVRILYGSASPSEAFQSSVLQVTAIDIDAFLTNVAGNAPCVGIDNVLYDGPSGPVMVRADDYSLEDVVTHVLRNAERYRTPASAITLRMSASETAASITIHNQGPNIDADLIDKIFEYGVSDQLDAGAHGNRGQGLFVAKTYMAKMGGTITAHNVADGVSIVLSLQRVTGG